jgi:hypothetical protein
MNDYEARPIIRMELPQEALDALMEKAQLDLMTARDHLTPRMAHRA